MRMTKTHVSGRLMIARNGEAIRAQSAETAIAASKALPLWIGSKYRSQAMGR